MFVNGIAAARALQIISSIPSNFASKPPEYVQAGSSISIQGDYPEVALRTSATSPGASSINESLPVAQTVGEHGNQAITSYQIPSGMPSGASTTVLTQPNGVELSFESRIYRIVSASIDRENLVSGQEAAFSYSFDFGPGQEGDVPIIISTSGPIQYSQSGLQQSMRIGADGRANVTGSILANQANPTGDQFKINVLIGGGG